MPKYFLSTLDDGRQLLTDGKDFGVDADAVPDLLAALKEIASRGPVEGYGSKGAVLLRLVATQSIARAAIAKAER